MSTANSYQIGQYVFIIVPVDELAFKLLLIFSISK